MCPKLTLQGTLLKICYYKMIQFLSGGWSDGVYAMRGWVLRKWFYIRVVCSVIATCACNTKRWSDMGNFRSVCANVLSWIEKVACEFEISHCRAQSYWFSIVFFSKWTKWTYSFCVLSTRNSKCLLEVMYK